ncbi:MAG: ATP-binding protein [Burkholderiaceae bacterium]|jgi:two-component system heavy metal sensor histidine kinase CusS|nr:ATP-binding protein [Burkholderiaceae bacterium]MEB2318396.1 ATP-binding protein [Pseudomonadota bacterium]
MTGLGQWRRSLHLRLASLLVLVVAMTFLVVGTVLFKVLEARLVAHDHDLLRHQARWLAGAEPAGDGDGPRDLRRRMAMLSSMQPGLRSSLQTTATGDVSLAGLDGGTPIRRELLDGEAFDVLDLSVHAEDLAVGQLRLMAPAAQRQSTLRRFGRIILVGSLAGSLLAALVSMRAVRWSRDRLQRLSRDARVAGHGGRLSIEDVDVELVDLVEAFNSSLDQLESAYRQSEGFSADVAHELRSPLATLIGGTQFVLSRERTSEQLRDALASNLEELERLKNLVNDMLFLARADRGERAQSLERVDLGLVADAMIDYCGALVDEAGLSVPRIGSASAVCNDALVRRAMVNLLSNAIRHAQGERQVELHLEALPGKVRIWVFNSGNPIPEDVAKRMFDRFFRANVSRSDHTVHHGLGLAIVHAVARMHGGSVFARIDADGNSIGFEIPSALASGQVRVRDAVREAPG